MTATDVYPPYLMLCPTLFPITHGQQSSCQASASHTLSLRAKPPRPNAALPPFQWLWNFISCPSWKSSASPLLGAE